MPDAVFGEFPFWSLSMHIYMCIHTFIFYANVVILLYIWFYSLLYLSFKSLLLNPKLKEADDNLMLSPT